MGGVGIERGEREREREREREGGGGEEEKDRGGRETDRYSILTHTHTPPFNGIFFCIKINDSFINFF